MSGGIFNYIQDDIRRAADIIESELEGNKLNNKAKRKFRIAIKALRTAAIMLQRIDWFMAGDDGEDTFNKRWDEDFKKFREGI